MENTRLLNLLDRFFENTCSPIEKEELMELLDSNQYDDVVKAYIDNTWDKVDLPHQLNDLQSEKILAAVLSQERTSVVVLPVSPWYKRKYWAAAAVLLISLSTAWILFHKTSSQRINTATAKHAPHTYKNDVSPGSTGAVLTLSDGSAIVLDSASDGNLARQGNIKIVMAGGSVQYVTQSSGNADNSGFNTIVTPRGKKFQIVLEDGTRVWLNAESSIRFPTAFGKKERQVDITGEAYFEVAKNAVRPFAVYVKGIKVEVLGTHFNINAYNDESAIKTTLLEGSVKVILNDKVKTLTPGQQANVDDKGELRLSKNVNTNEVVAWKNDLFLFNNTDIKSLMRQVSRWYDVEIAMPQNMEGVTFIGHISRKSNLSDVLKMLELTGEVSFSIEGKKVVVIM